MEDTLKLEIKHRFYENKIEVDNTDDTKKMRVEESRGGSLNYLSIKRYFDRDNNNEEVLKIGGIYLKGREIEIFKDFINQKHSL